jgi:hypothetical protein
MFNVLSEINWLAVIVAVIPFAVLGGLYFTAIIPKQYAAAVGTPGTQGALFIVGPLVVSVVVVITSAVLLKALDVTALGDGIVFGLLVSVGYLVAQTFQIAINPAFARPLHYGLLNAPYFIVCGTAASVILTAWQ